MYDTELNQENLNEMYRPLSLWAYIGYTLLFSIPIIGLIFLIIFSFSSKNINRKNYARAYLIITAVVFVISLSIGIYIHSQANKIIDEATNQLDAFSITLFNSQLKAYEGEIYGRNVESLLETVELINDEDLFEDVVVVGETDIDIDSKYNVSFEYDSNGVINKVNIALAD